MTSLRRLAAKSPEVERLHAVLQTQPHLNPYLKRYWWHQFSIGWFHLRPFLVAQEAFQPGMRVIEVGCAEAGVLAAFLLAGPRKP
ncbi:MAG: hypothetical protein ABDH91_06190 [Bacteroidia bacterium]